MVHGAGRYRMARTLNKDRRKREQLCIAELYVSAVCGKMQTSENPICLVDAAVSLIFGSHEDVRFIGHHLGNVTRTKCLISS
jgi:hypothetical protein